MTQASAAWTGASLTFAITSGSGHSIIADEPLPLGDDSGMEPPEMLLGALCACTGISAVSLLRKMRQPLISLIVRADGDRQPDWPKAFTQIRLHFEIGGGQFDPERIEAALERAVHRYCPVGGTIELGTGGCEITYGYEVVDRPID